MDFVKGLFGQNPEQQQQRQQRQQQQRQRRTADTRNRLHQSTQQTEQRAARLEREVAQLRQKAMVARKNGQNEHAKQLLRSMQLKANQLRTLGNYQGNMAVVNANIESTQMAAETMGVMREGADMQRELMREMGSPDDVTEQMEDLTDTLHEGQEFIEAVSTPIDLSMSVPALGEDALEAQLSELDDEIALADEEDLSRLGVPSTGVAGPAPAAATSRTTSTPLSASSSPTAAATSRPAYAETTRSPRQVRPDRGAPAAPEAPATQRRSRPKKQAYRLLAD